MDFVTYQFESPAQFFDELSDLLEEGGFHESPEAQVNTFLSLLVQYQDEFLDPAGRDLEQSCYRLLDSDLFQNNTLSIAASIIDRAIQVRVTAVCNISKEDEMNPRHRASQDNHDMWITYNVLLYAGQELPKIFNWMLKSEFFAKLKYQILQTDHMRLQPLAVNLMYEMCRVQSLKPCDLALADEDFLYYLLDLVERTRDDTDEQLNYGSIKLLLAFNEQYMLNSAACRAASNYTPSNLLLATLSDRPGASCTFGENLIFMLNRAEDTALQMLILKLLYLLFTSPKHSLNEFFYTNDLHVLVDVVLRELRNLPEEEESLRHAYLRVMGPLLTNTQLRNEQAIYKRAEILRCLGELGGGDQDDDLRARLWEQELLEQQQQQQLRQANASMRKLTYRDRQSSASSPAASSYSSFSSQSKYTSLGASCPSPILTAEMERQQPHHTSTAV
ncbi:hypothetical protein BGZ70_006457 [Mortierella alpina]|uniref:SPIN90/Ldb17 leucine-rich domain-containing protein n=1 Tax=Mortierella alpina TaxID=64518 RepID=A0A9P6M3N0_MORAP|nr:hypothetical protein BGZ70_006457 [Mortierella alpina]